MFKSIEGHCSGKNNERVVGAGRVLDLIEGGKLATDTIKFFVLDEADRLLDTGNLDVILKLFQRFPKTSSGTSRLQVGLPQVKPVLCTASISLCLSFIFSYLACQFGHEIRCLACSAPIAADCDPCPWQMKQNRDSSHS